MIVVFLVDTSASMNQKFSNGMSALECTKSGIEHLVKHLPHVKPAEKHNDKFMLVSYEEGTACVKSSFKDPLPHLIKELKVLKANDMSNPGSSLSTIFDLLNVYRVYHGIDTPASGRFPGTIEPSIILWFTDGGRQSSPAGTLDRLNIPGITSAGVDYYHEPFRWDQRLYTIFFEPNTEMVDPQLSILSTVMGGASYRVRTLRHMLQAMDCMLGISKIPPTQNSPQAVLHIYGVVVNFEDLIDPRRPNTANHHQLVYVNPSWLSPQARHPGFFPIPEPFWPEVDAQRLPTRNAQPTMHYHTKEEKSVEIPDGFPYDKYVVAPCPMTQELLTRPPGSCWPVYIKNSYKTEGFGFPFGFLKANTNKNAVTLTVVAYNYPALFTLLVNLNSIPGRTPTQEWLRDFAEYLSHTPSYYYAPLRNALKRMGLFNIIPQDQGALSPGILKILSKNKMQAKVELDRFLATESNAVLDTASSKKKTLCANAFDVPRSELISVLDEMKKIFFKDLQITSFTAPSSSLDTKSNISQPPLKSSLGAMRVSTSRLESIIDSDDLHSLPIADMGIYQDRMQKIQQENLRDPFRDEESVKSLQRTMFGNPYKQDKKVSIDEEDEASAADQTLSSNSTVSGSTWSSILGRKRKPRRRSISPSHFPIEKIPSLARGDRQTSGKVQVVSFGPFGGKAVPLLNILVQNGSGKAQLSLDTTDSLGRHLVMHDGEDEDEDDDDFRRAMFNSDEMELDGEDEAARLRADTPMPGGMGLDDDDEEMEELQHAQDRIPPPILPISLDDIAGEDTRISFHKGNTAENILGQREYDKHRQEVQEDLEHLTGTSKPVFESISYNPNTLMELQSIPQVIPDRISSAVTPQAQTTSSKDDEPLKQGDSFLDTPNSMTGVATETLSNPNNLTPIPILFPLTQENVQGASASMPVLSIPIPSPTTDPSQITIADVKDGNIVIQPALSSGKAIEQGMETTSSAGLLNQTTQINPLKATDPTTREKNGNALAPHATATSLLRKGQSEMKATPLDIKNRIIKQLKMGPKTYNEQAILDIVSQVEAAPNWSKEQKRAAMSGCLNLAKGLRRAGVVNVLESLLMKIKLQ
ncbi:Integrator complex subunit 6 [Mortierella sp. AM989]|nr:Integrator complex subunit 6 [Mortierella sp. AM989]